MHIPDGLMSPEVWGIGLVLVLPLIAWAVIKVDRTMDERATPLMAVLAAGIFVAQMLNFPIGGGTTGHLIGAALAVVLLGLPSAIVVMTVVLLIQGLVFGDGGLTALGLNLLNMAVVATFTAWVTLKLVPAKRRTLAIPLAAWISVFCAASACALELSLSYALHPGQYGITAWVAIPAMLSTHAVIGVGEAVITGGVVIYLAKVAPGILRLNLERKDRTATEASDAGTEEQKEVPS